MSEWLVVLLGLIGLAPQPQPEATVTPLIELALPELAGADRRFIRFDDDATGVEVQRMIMRKDAGFAIVDYRNGSGGYTRDAPWLDDSPTFLIRGGRHAAPFASRWSAGLEWQFFRAASAGLDCIALRKPVRLRDDPGNVARVVEADLVSLVCLPQGMLTGRDAMRVSEALEINDTGDRPLGTPRHGSRAERELRIPPPFDPAALLRRLRASRSLD